MFDAFLTAFSEAKHDNETMARRKEEEEKRALLEAQVSREGRRELLMKVTQATSVCLDLSFVLQLKRDREQKTRKATANEEEGGEFDDLVSALRSGEVFDRDLSKMNRKKQRKPNLLDSNRERAVTKLKQ